MFRNLSGVETARILSVYVLCSSVSEREVSEKGRTQAEMEVGGEED